MLDTKSTFDAAILRYARDEAQTQKILGSRLYRNLRDSLSGTQEYMAVEKLYQLHQEGGYDLIVVDTPPTRRAMDFLGAPSHLTRLLDNPAIRMLVMPSRAYIRAFSFAARAPLNAIAKIVGAETFLDTMAFLRAFEGMEAGISKRAKRVDELFAEPGTAFVLVVVPREDAIDEGRLFAAYLREFEIPVQFLIVNRLHPHFDAQSAAAQTVDAGGQSSATQGRGKAQAFANLKGDWEQLRALAEREENYVVALAAQLKPSPVARVPLLDEDVHDLVGVRAVSEHLFGPSDSRHRRVASSAMPPSAAKGS
jgi:anion-transporting  ArsA/GET3 family ATPase